MSLQGLQHCICGFISLQFNFDAANIVCGNTNILSVVWCSGGATVNEPLRSSTIAEEAPTRAFSYFIVERAYYHV